jgi:hypothetical protein
MAGIFVASSVPDPPMPARVSDVSLHGVAYVGLTHLVIRALAADKWRGVTAVARAAAWAVAVS